MPTRQNSPTRNRGVRELLPDLPLLLHLGYCCSDLLHLSRYLHPNGPFAVKVLPVVGAAMAEAGVVGIDNLTLSRR
jgi:hypothetical protein